MGYFLKFLKGISVCMKFILVEFSVDEEYSFCYFFLFDRVDIVLMMLRIFRGSGICSGFVLLMRLEWKLV